MRTRAVLIDALGTLVSMRPPAPRLREALRSATGLDVGEQAAADAFRAEIAYYLEHHLEGRDAASLDDLRDRCAAVLQGALRAPAIPRRAVRQAMLEALRFDRYPDAEPALRALRAGGLRLVVASNWDCSLSGVLREAGLRELVDAVVSSAAAGVAKPDPRLFAAALDAAGCDSAEALHVGDSVANDVAGARAAGVRAVLLRRDGPATGPPAGAPVIASLEALPGLV